MTSVLRDSIQSAIETGSYQRAASLLGQLMREEPSPSNASYVVSRFTEIRSHLQLTPYRVAVLRSFTIEPVIPFLRTRCFAAGIDATVHVGGFNAYVQELLDPGSSLYHFDPDIIILAVRTQDVLPALWEQVAGLVEGEAERIVETTLANFEQWIETLRSRSKAHLILHNLEFPPYPSQGVLDSQRVCGQKEAIHRFNRGLQQLAQRQPGVYVLDYDGLVARHGWLQWHDERKWLTIRMPIAADCLVHLADAYMHFIHPLIGKVCKVLVVDLDNTLWGGVLGEDGPQGIQLNLEYPGAAYRAFQRVILDLYERGVILAICSKNDTVEALEVLENHPHMLLRPKHFASTRINWDEKTENLRQIATELNVGLDSLAFLDDSPVERAAVRNRLPEIYVVDLPADAIGYAQALRECPVFERTNLSAEDKERGRYYAEQRQRAELQKSAGSLEEFYYSLEMKAEVSEADASTIPRIAQLTQKTNQFNLTTRKRTEQEVTLLAQDPHTRVFAVRLTDRFGDNGIVGAAISRIRGECCEIDTFLLSCRVIGRTVETAMLACIAEAAHRDGAKELTGWYFPTRKNAPARDFYARHGFTQISEDQGNSLWRFDLTKGQIEGPSWIECKYAQRAKDYDARFPGAAGAPDRR